MAYVSRYFTEFHHLKQLWTVIGLHGHFYSLNQNNSSLSYWDQNCVGTNCWCSCLIWSSLCVIMYFPSQSDTYSGVHPIFDFQCTKTKLGVHILHILGYNNLKCRWKLNTQFLRKLNKRGGPIGPDTLYVYMLTNIAKLLNLREI